MTELEGLLSAMGLKDETRTGWDLRGISNPEHVADHSWGVAFLTLLYGQTAGIDVDHALKLAVLHDLAEAETGDIPTRAVDVKNNMSAEEKHAQEFDAIQALFHNLDATELQSYWDEYERRETPEAIFVKDMDLIDLVLQALQYEKDGRYDPEEDNPHFQHYDNLDEFFATSESHLQTETGKRLFSMIREAYEQVKQ